MLNSVVEKNWRKLFSENEVVVTLRNGKNRSELGEGRLGPVEPERSSLVGSDAEGSRGLAKSEVEP